MRLVFQKRDNLYSIDNVGPTQTLPCDQSAENLTTVPSHGDIGFFSWTMFNENRKSQDLHVSAFLGESWVKQRCW